MLPHRPRNLPVVTKTDECVRSCDFMEVRILAVNEKGIWLPKTVGNNPV